MWTINNEKVCLAIFLMREKEKLKKILGEITDTNTK
jgi:hypothetical protein